MQGFSHTTGRTKGGAILLLDGLARGQAIRGGEEGVEAAGKVHQRAGVAAACLAREQRVALRTAERVSDSRSSWLSNQSACNAAMTTQSA